jgi:hypothetical protein
MMLSMLLMVGLMTAQAQRGGGEGRRERPDPKKMAQATADKWQEEFGLSDEQHTKVYDLLIETGEKQREKMQELRASGSVDREAMREAFTEMRDAQEKKLKEIFSDTQWTAYEKWKKENPPLQRGRGGRGGGN